MAAPLDRLIFDAVYGSWILSLFHYLLLVILIGFFYAAALLTSILLKGHWEVLLDKWGWKLVGCQN